MDISPVCYNYACDKYPLCARAKGRGCCIEQDESVPTVDESECTADGGYPLFVPEK